MANVFLLQHYGNPDKTLWDTIREAGGQILRVIDDHTVGWTTIEFVADPTVIAGLRGTFGANAVITMKEE